MVDLAKTDKIQAFASFRFEGGNALGELDLGDWQTEQVQL